MESVVDVPSGDKSKTALLAVAATNLTSTSNVHPVFNPLPLEPVPLPLPPIIGMAVAMLDGVVSALILTNCEDVPLSSSMPLWNALTADESDRSTCAHE